MLIKDIIWSGIEKARISTKILDRLKASTPLRSPTLPVQNHSIHGKLLETLAKRNKFPEELFDFCVHYDVNYALSLLEEKNIAYLCKHLLSESEVILEIVTVLENEITKRKETEQQNNVENKNLQ